MGIINFTSSNSTRYAYTIATMRLSIAAALAASASCAAAFKDTSPFVMFSDSKLPQDLNTAQLQTSSSILASAKVHLSTCPSQIYYILTQPSLLASELSTHAPHLKNAVESTTALLTMASQLPVADHNEKGLGGAGHDLSSTGSPKLDHSNTAGYTPEASAWDGTVRDDN